MSVNVNDLNLKVTPFSRRLSRLMVVEGYPEAGDDAGFPKMYVTLSQNFDGPTRTDLIRFQPIFDGKPIPFTYKACPSLLTLKTEKGDLSLVFDGENMIRFRSDSGLGVRFFMAFEAHELFIDRLDGTYEAGFAEIGEFLFETPTGSMSFTGRWLAPRMKPDDTTVEWSPENGQLEGYIRYGYDIVNRIDNALRPFDECVKENKADYEGWVKKYAPMPEKYRETALHAMYVTWVCFLPPKGLLPTNSVYMMRAGTLTRAMGWQQSYHAMGLWRDPEVCFDLMYSMFTMQDEFGMIPDGASERETVYTSTKPPFQGFALTWIFDHIGIENIPADLIEKLYGPMCRWINWWRTFRDIDHDGLLCYCHADESGYDDSSIFAGGMPVESPCLASFMVLCLEAAGRMAERLGKKDEAAQFMADSKAMLERMIESFWNGSKFICLKDGTHEVIDEESVSVYQPIILGKRLPEDIIDKLADALGDPERFFTEHGIASESQKSPYYDPTGAFVLGMPICPIELMISLGLYAAGKTELAVKCAKVWLDLGNENPDGALTTYRPAPPAVVDENGEEPVYTGIRFPGGVCSWGMAVFIILCEMLTETGKEK